MTNPIALIIEDDPKLAEIFTFAVQKAGFDIETIHDGNSAVARLAEICPSLVILDLHLPNVSGEQILQQIRADERLAKTNVILATADALTADKLRAASNLVLLKPIDFSQLTNLAARFRPSQPSTSDDNMTNDGT